MANVNEQAIVVSHLNKSFFVNEEYGSLIRRILNKKTKEIKAISNISFEVNRGEIVAILGKNGAGKTTLIKIMSGILTQTKGEVNILGYNPYKERYRYSYHIGVVLGQKSLLWNNIPVIESFKLYKEIYDISNKQFDDRLELFNGMFGIKNLLYTPVRKLSLGQRMKCEIVAALLHNPDVLFLDEPTIGLDLLSKQQIYDFLERIHKELNTTILLTTHNINDVERLCNRVILLDKGQKVYDDSKENLLELDTQKEIIIKGNIPFANEILNYDVRRSENNKEILVRCEKKQVVEIIKLMNDVPDVCDIEIKGTDLETILAKIYKGDISL